MCRLDIWGLYSFCFLFYFCHLRSWKVNIYHYYSTQLMPYIYDSVLHISLLCRRLASAIKRGQSYFHLLQKEEQEEHKEAERRRMRREEQLRTEPRPPSVSSDSDSDSGGWGNISSHQRKSQDSRDLWSHTQQSSKAEKFALFEL